MSYHRREFIRQAALGAVGLALTKMSFGLAGCNAVPQSSASRNFGIQLYTLRDVLPQDPKGVLTQLASFGYKQIESYEGDKGMFWGMTNMEFKKLMDDLGMKIVSSHCDINKDFERKAAEAAEIGMDYLICPWLGPQKSIDDFKRYADVFNQRGEVCKQHNLRFGYHNHDYGFIPLNGQLPQDVLMQNTDPNLVDYEMDIYWVVTAGQDPIAWFNKYPGRFKLSHVKDRKKNAPLSEKDATVDLGTGEIPFTKILDAGKDKGLRYFIVEQEKYENTTPMDAARVDAEYMKQLTL